MLSRLCSDCLPFLQIGLFEANIDIFLDLLSCHHLVRLFEVLVRRNLQKYVRGKVDNQRRFCFALTIFVQLGICLCLCISQVLCDSVQQGGRSWQPFGEGKIGHRRVFAIFARNALFQSVIAIFNSIPYIMQYIPCNSALLAQEPLFLTQKDKEIIIFQLVKSHFWLGM